MKTFTTVAFAALAFLGHTAHADSSSGSGSGPVLCPAIGCDSSNPIAPVCGTNGVTYNNTCELSLAAMCSGRKKIELAYNGTCTKDGKPPSTTTDAPSTTTKVPAPAPTTTPKSDAKTLYAVGLSATLVVAAAAFFTCSAVLILTLSVKTTRHNTMILTKHLVLAAACLATSTSALSPECQEMWNLPSGRVCASNGQSYNNYCEVEYLRAKTNDSSLVVVHTGDCSTNSTNDSSTVNQVQPNAVRNGTADNGPAALWAVAASALAAVTFSALI